MRRAIAVLVACGLVSACRGQEAPAAPALPAPGGALRPANAQPVARPCDRRGPAQLCRGLPLDAGTLQAAAWATPGNGAIPDWSVELFVPAGARWRAVLIASGEPDTWSGVVANAAAFGGVRAAAIGFRYAGTGDALDYELVIWRKGEPVRVALRREGLRRASLEPRGKALIEYEADYSRGEANCCPERFARRIVEWTGEGFRVRDDAFVKPDEVPPGLL